MTNAQINSYVHLQFVCRPFAARIRHKQNCRLAAPYSLRRRPWSWPCDWRPPFRNDWSISCYHGRHASRLLLYHWSRIRPQLWRLVFLPISHRISMGSCVGHCPWIAFRDVYAKDKRACERPLHSNSFLGPWSWVNLYFSLYP